MFKPGLTNGAGYGSVQEGRLFATSGLGLLSVTDSRTPVPGACTVVTVALVQAGTEELVFIGGGEYDEAQGERLLPGTNLGMTCGGESHSCEGWRWQTWL